MRNRLWPLMLLSLCLLPLAGADRKPLHTRGPLNEGLPQWITFGVQSRWRAEGQRGAAFRSDTRDDFLLIRNRLSLDLKPWRFAQFHFVGQDARSVGIENPNASVRNVFDIREAYAYVGNEASWWRLQVGRQRIAYGTERVIGAAEWGNTARVFDAARLSLRQGPNSVDIFSASVVENDTDAWDHHAQGNNLHGAYASLGSVIPEAHVEPYVLYRTNHALLGDSWTTGVRTAGQAGQRWSYEVEAIKQQGAARPGMSLDSWAALVQVQRYWTDRRWQPSLIAEFNYASGDKHPDDTTVNTYDQLYPTNHGIYGIADQVGRRNTRQMRGGVWIHPRKWLTLRTEGHSFWLASRYDGLYSAGGSLSIAPVVKGAMSTHVGNEFDITAEAKPHPYYTIGVQYGHFFVGDFVRQNSAGFSPVFYAMYLDFRM